MRKLIAVAVVVAAGLGWTMTVTHAQLPGGGQGVGRGQGVGQGRALGRVGGGPGGMPGRGGGRGVILGGLGLTEDQHAQVKALFESERASHQANVKALMEARSALREAIFANSVDANAVAALQARIVAAEQAQLSAEVKTELALSGILTPEQRAKVATRRGPGRAGGGRIGRR